MSFAARRTASPHEGLAAFPTRPTRLMGLMLFFNQRQEFLVPRRAEQRGFSYTNPPHPVNGCHKLLQLVDDTLVDRGIGNDTFSLVHFLFAGFKLRLDKGNDASRGA